MGFFCHLPYKSLTTCVANSKRKVLNPVLLFDLFSKKYKSTLNLRKSLKSWASLVIVQISAGTNNFPKIASIGDHENSLNEGLVYRDKGSPRLENSYLDLEHDKMRRTSTSSKTCNISHISFNNHSSNCGMVAIEITK